MTRSKYTTPAAAASAASRTKSKGLKHPKSPDAEVKLSKEKKKTKKVKEPEPEPEEEEEEDEDAAAAEPSDEEEEFEPSSGEEEEEEEEVQRNPIGDQLALPADSEKKVKKVKKVESVLSRRRKACIRRADSRASREQSGLFGSSGTANTRPGSFRALLSEFIPDGQVNPRISKTALELMQRGIETVSQSIILPGASQALLVSQSFATPEARDAARLTKSILDRHMDSSVRNFLFAMCPTLVPVLDENLAQLHQIEAIKAAKRKEREESLATVRRMKDAIDTLRKKEAAFVVDANSLLGKFNAEDRQQLIALTIEYDTSMLDKAKAAESKLTNAIANGDARIEKIADITIPKVTAKVKELKTVTLPMVNELIETARSDIEKADLAFKVFMAKNDDELTELNKKREKFSPEEKALRKEARFVRRNTTTQRTILANHEARLASVNRRIKEQTKRVAVLKVTIHEILARIAKNKELLVPATLLVKTWRSALAKSKRVLTKENKMDEEEKEADEDEMEE